MKNFFYKKNNKLSKHEKSNKNTSPNLNYLTKSNLKKNQNIIKKIKQERNRKYSKIMLIIKIAAILLVLLLGFKIFSIVGKFNKKLNLNDIGLSETDEAAERQLNDITNIAIFGIDDNNVSDAIMITSLDKLNNNLKLISVSRDSLVPIENPKTKKIYYSKINEAYSNGKETTMLKTLNKNFNIRLFDYITINFEGLVDVVDELGGLDVEISKKESHDIDGIINTTKSLKRKHREMLNGQFGNCHLNGSQAVAYVRIRKTKHPNGLTDDFGRTFRQRKFMNLIFQKVMNLNKAKIPGLIKTFLPYMKTSLDFKTIFSIYSCIKAKHFEIKPAQVPLPAYTINPDYTYNNKSTVFYDIDYAGKVINELIYNNTDPEDYIEKNPPNVKKIQNSKPIKHNKAYEEDESNVHNHNTKNSAKQKINSKFKITQATQTKPTSRLKDIKNHQKKSKRTYY